MEIITVRWRLKFWPQLSVETRFNLYGVFSQKGSHCLESECPQQNVLCPLVRVFSGVTNKKSALKQKGK